MVTIEEIPPPPSPARPKHDWSQAAAAPPSSTRLPIQDKNGGGHDTSTDVAHLLSTREAENLVHGLQTFTLQEVGSSAWLQQHQAMERLNAQAHQSARCPDTPGGEFVLEAFVAHDKVATLVHDLVLLDCWKDKVWPRLAEGVVARRATMRAYFVLFHEATVVNLLEVLLYHLQACEAAGDALVDLVDYCAGKMALLNSGYFGGKTTAEKEEENVRARAAALADRDPGESLAAQARTIQFQAAVTAVGILRLLCGHVEDLPLGVCTRLVHTHDVPLALVPLLETPPWTRKRSSSKGAAAAVWEKLGPDFEWRAVPPKDLLLLTKHEAQVWLAIFHLLTSPQVRQRYHFNRFRKGQLLRLRKYLTEALLDQVPVLADIRRFLDELAILEVPEPTAAGAGGTPAMLLVEQVAELRAAVLSTTGLRGKEKAEEEAAMWEALAQATLAAHFTREGGDAQDPDLKLLAAVYTTEWVEEVVASSSSSSSSSSAGEDKTRPCSHCGKEATKRCARCNGLNWYCSRVCQVAKWKSHKKVCDVVAADLAKAK